MSDALKHCDCLNESRKRLKKHLGDAAQSFPTSMRPAKAKAGEPDFLVLSNGFLNLTSGSSQLAIPYTATWTVGEKRKETKINMIASHCPFCGTPLKTK